MRFAAVIRFEKKIALCS